MEANGEVKNFEKKKFNSPTVADFRKNSKQGKTNNLKICNRINF